MSAVATTTCPTWCREHVPGDDADDRAMHQGSVGDWIEVTRIEDEAIEGHLVGPADACSAADLRRLAAEALAAADLIEASR